MASSRSEMEDQEGAYLDRPHSFSSSSFWDTYISPGIVRIVLGRDFRTWGLCVGIQTSKAKNYEVCLPHPFSQSVPSLYRRRGTRQEGWRILHVRVGPSLGLEWRVERLWASREQLFRLPRGLGYFAHRGRRGVLTSPSSSPPTSSSAPHSMLSKVSKPSISPTWKEQIVFLARYFGVGEEIYCLRRTQSNFYGDRSLSRPHFLS